MGDLFLRVLALLLLLAAGLALLVSAAVRLYERQKQRESLPHSDLPGLDPSTYMDLHRDIEAFEAGERP